MRLVRGCVGGSWRSLEMQYSAAESAASSNQSKVKDDERTFASPLPRCLTLIAHNDSDDDDSGQMHARWAHTRTTRTLGDWNDACSRKSRLSTSNSAQGRLSCSSDGVRPDAGLAGC